MSLKEIDKKVGYLFKEWKSLQPLKGKNQEQLDKKIRLDWNYNSNHIEGNTLTYGQTELLLIFDRYEGGHHGRDYMEMKAHDVAIKKIKQLAKDKNRQLTESDIRELNLIILKESFWKEAQTSDGRETRKEIIPGRYKKQPNHVKTKSGEIFKFAEPLEVPSQMNDLMKWFNKKLNEKIPSIASFIAQLHHRFILIHPFDDGNGRIVRLWINYVLLYLGYPPLIIKSEDKDNYFLALNKADTGDMDSLAEYLGKNLITWLEIGIKAAKGEDIKEPSDVDKEVYLYIQDQKGQGLNKSIIFSKDTISRLCTDCLNPFFNDFDRKFSCFSVLFETKEITMVGYSEHNTYTNVSFNKLGDISTHIKNNIIGDMKKWHIYLNKYNISNQKLEILISIIYKEFKGKTKKKKINPFNLKIDMFLIFKQYEYTTDIKINNRNNVFTENYNEPWSENKISEIISKIKEVFFDSIKKKYLKSG